MDKEYISSDAGAWIENVIRGFIVSSPRNTMEDESNEAAWDDVLVGFASGADPIWQQYKEYIGAFHWTPGKSITSTVPGNPPHRMN